MTPALHVSADQRLQQIEQARRAVMVDGRPGGRELGWIERSWWRCLARGRRPDQRVSFDVIPAQAARRSEEANHGLVQAARPVLDRLGRAIASTRYFAILTNAQGVVIDAHGPIDRSDRRADLITRIGVDLSEPSVGTSAIGAALTELQPVWLHRSEHFFADTSVYSCAGAPLFGPDGDCVGMLDLTGIDAAERPELKHLVTQSARSIENALTRAQPHKLLVHLTWPGRPLGDDSDGLLGLDADGWVTGANEAARQMVPQLAVRGDPVHCSELFAQPWEQLYDQARRSGPVQPVELPLWSGLRLLALPQVAGAPAGESALQVPLRDAEIAMIRKAVADARGNVMKAAQALGISRATVYRKLTRK